MKTILIILVLLSGKSLLAQKNDQLMEEGNTLYQKNEFTKASEVYEQILKDQPDNLVAEYNLGITNYKIGNTKKAAVFFAMLVKRAKDISLAEKAYYNLGVLLLKSQKLQQAATAFENALKLDANDTECRENLQLVLNKLKEQTQPKQQAVSVNEKQKTQNEENDRQSKKDQSSLDKQTAEQLLNNLDQEEEKFSDSLLSKKKALQQEGTKNW
jgi:Ca-activated chloride channel family protein